MVSSGKRRILNSLRNSYKTTMIAATKDTSFRLISVLMSVMTVDVICTKALKLALGYVPIQEKVHKLINFNQEA